jgi:hypothetical protein
VKRAFFLLSLFVPLLSPFYSLAQIPSGYVQTVATVASLANGQYSASWTNLSSSPQLGLLGCVSTFQTTAGGAFDSNGHLSVLLADTAQICPSPSTWTFQFTFSCPVGSPTGGFSVQVPVTGGGTTEDISAQISAALPTTPCGGAVPGTYVSKTQTTLQTMVGPLAGPSATFGSSIILKDGDTWVNVKGPAFGAKGDGVTDDTTAIQAAHTLCSGFTFPGNGCTLYFPTGIYIVDGLTMNNYDTWGGDGWGISVIKLKNNTTADVVTVPNYAYNVHLENLSIDGNDYGGGNGNCLTFAATPDAGDGTDYPTTKGVQSTENTSKNSTIESVALAYCNGQGLLVNNFNYGLHVHNLWVQWTNSYGIWDLGANHFYDEVYVQYALSSGVLNNGGNNTFSSIHTYWNGDGGATNEANFFEQGNRSILVALDSEDSYTNGYQNGASDSICSECIVTSGGYPAYETGTVKVTNGSTSVTGIGTSWTNAFNGYGLLVNGTNAGVSTVNSTTSITLSSAWTGPTQNVVGQLYRLYNNNPTGSFQYATGFAYTGQRGHCVACALVTYRPGTIWYTNGFTNAASNLQAGLDINVAPGVATTPYTNNGQVLQQWGNAVQVEDNTLNILSNGTASSGATAFNGFNANFYASTYISGATHAPAWTIAHLASPDSLILQPPQLSGSYFGTPGALVTQLGTATSSANFASGGLGTQASTWNGSIPTYPSSLLQTTVGTGTNPTVTTNLYPQLNSGQLYDLEITGNTAGTAATAGNIGQDVKTVLGSGSAISLSANTSTNITSLSLTPGDWDIDGVCAFVASSATSPSPANWSCGVSTTSGSISGLVGLQNVSFLNTFTSATFGLNQPTKRTQILVTSTETVYLVVFVEYTSGTVAGYGTIEARRVH